MTPKFQNYLRSVSGQLHLFLAVFLGAISLSVVTCILRPYLFEPYIRQLPVKSQNGNETLTDRLRRGIASADEIQVSLDRLVDKLLDVPEVRILPATKEQLAIHRALAKERLLPEVRMQLASGLYWDWLDRESADGNQELIKQLLFALPDATIQNMHRTIVVGNFQQQKRAFQGLLQAKQMGIDQADAVIEFAQRKAKRRHEKPF